MRVGTANLSAPLLMQEQKKTTSKVKSSFSSRLSQTINNNASTRTDTFQSTIKNPTVFSAPGGDVINTDISPDPNVSFTVCATAAEKSCLNQEPAAVAEREKVQGTAPLSEGSYEERLERLRELHKNTDYSGLSELDKERLIRGRFYEAFGSEFGVIGSGFYKPLGENTIYAEIYNEENRQEREVVNLPDNLSGAEMARNFRYSLGYENLSDDEIRKKIAERYSGGTLADRYAACWELLNLRIDDDAANATMWHIRDGMVRATESEYGHLFRNNPIRVKAMFAYATGTKASWSELVKGAWNVIDHATVKGGSDAVYEEMKQRLKEQLFEFLDHMNFIEEGILQCILQ